MELDNKRCSWCFVNAASHMPNKSFFFNTASHIEKRRKRKGGPRRPAFSTEAEGSLAAEASTRDESSRHLNRVLLEAESQLPPSDPATRLRFVSRNAILRSSNNIFHEDEC